VLAGDAEGMRKYFMVRSKFENLSKRCLA
jgi:hypothetical protein